MSTTPEVFAQRQADLRAVNAALTARRIAHPMLAHASGYTELMVSRQLIGHFPHHLALRLTPRLCHAIESYGVPVSDSLKQIPKSEKP